MGFFAFLTRKSSDRSLNSQMPRNAPPSRQSTTSSFRTLIARIRCLELADLATGKSPLGISRSVQELRQEYREPAASKFSLTAVEEADSSQLRQQPLEQDDDCDARPSTAPMADGQNKPSHDRLLSRSAGFVPSKRLSTLSTNSHHGATSLRRYASVRSVQTFRSVDLLDARGEFRPSDFRARLAASGTRDYGEDVADRNIGENGVILSSTPVQTFCAGRPVLRDVRTPEMVIRKQMPIEAICEAAEDGVSVSSSPFLGRPPSRSTSVRTNPSIRKVPSRRPASREGSRSTDMHSISVASSIKNRSSVISIGRPKLEQGILAPSVAEESDDSACPPTVPRYRHGEPEANHRPQTQAGLSCAQAASSVSPVEHRGQLPIDNISFWAAPQIRLQNDSAAYQPSTPHHLGHNLSRRNWSIASTAPTTEGSETSSVLNIRSQSRCTAHTSIDLESLPETEEETTEKEVTPCGEGAPVLIQNSYETDLSYTTDGSDIDSFIKKRIHRAVPDGEALLFRESGFQDGGGALPGLFDRLQVLMTSIPTPVAEEAQELEDNDEGAESNFSVQTPESASGMFVPSMYLTQRQRMIALGFDYDTDDEELEAMDSDTCEEIGRAQKSNIPRLAMPLQSFRPMRSQEDKWSDDTKAKMALTLRREVKKHKRSSLKPRRVLKDAMEVDGNVADIE